MESIVTEYGNICVICGRPAEAQHHLIFGIALRQLAEKDGLKIPICNKCHNEGKVSERIHGNSIAESLSKIVGQLAWEKHCIVSGKTEEEARKLFRKRYGRSYL